MGFFLISCPQLLQDTYNIHDYTSGIPVLTPVFCLSGVRVVMSAAIFAPMFCRRAAYFICVICIYLLILVFNTISITDDGRVGQQ